MIYEKGKVYPEHQGQDKIVFDISDTGIDLYIRFSNLSDKEVESILKDKVRVSTVTLKGIIFMVFKFKDIPTMDTPYHAKLSRNLTNLQEPQEGQGYALNITLFDGTTGEFKGTRLLGLSTRFSKILKKEVDQQMLDDFNPTLFDINRDEIYRKYTSKELEKMAIN